MNLTERDAWIIAYPDHISEVGCPTLIALADLLRDVLSPQITGVHTLPLHPASGDGGFSVIDPDSVDPQFGTWDDVRALAAQTAWMADAVVNHLSTSSPWFRGFLDGEPYYSRFFATLDPGTDVTAVVRPRTSPLSHPFARADGSTVHVWTTFSADQADLDYSNPAVLAAMTAVLERYVSAGAAAIRLDAIAFVGKDPATASVNRPGAHDVVRSFRAGINRIGADVMLVTETNLPHDENVSYLAPGEADAVYQFPLPPLVAYAILSGDVGPLVSWLTSLAFPTPPATYLNVLATHDGIGLRGAEGLLPPAALDRLIDATNDAGGVVNVRSSASGPVPYELAVSWFDLMAAGVDETVARRRHLAAHAIALAVRGHPLLYLNSLFGVGNDVDRYATTGHARDLNRRRLRREDLDRQLATPGSRAADVWAGIADMLARRASSPAFDPGSPQLVHQPHPGVVVIERRAESGERALVAVNVTDAAVRVALPDATTADLAPYGSSWSVGESVSGDSTSPDV